MSIFEKLIAIQTELKAPKGQYNSFGKYKYRSCEDILEAVKPVLKKHKASLVISDDIVSKDGRFYVCATATIYDTESDATVSNKAFAREEDIKKGMDGSQVTGTASSYARKYALNGLFLIDDTKDADSDEYKLTTNKKHGETAEDTAENMKMINEIGNLKISDIKVKIVKDKIRELNINEEKLLAQYQINKVEDMTETLFATFKEQCDKAAKK